MPFRKLKLDSKGRGNVLGFILGKNRCKGKIVKIEKWFDWKFFVIRKIKDRGYFNSEIIGEIW
jgi:hypothetical protein